MDAVPAFNISVSRSNAVVEIRHLSQSFGGPRVLSDLSLDLAEGSFVALLGRSGSGKSTLLRLLAGLDQVTTGTVKVPQERAVVFQEPRLVPWMTAIQNVTLGLRTPDAEMLATKALTEVGLSHRMTAWPLTLSGGEAQRVALARGLVRQPKLMLLDEPFAALDALTRMKMQQMIVALWQMRRPAILLVTHDVDEALLLAERVLVLDHGRISQDIAVDLERPRRHGDPVFIALRERLLAELGVNLKAIDVTKPDID